MRVTIEPSYKALYRSSRSTSRTDAQNADGFNAATCRAVRTAARAPSPPSRNVLDKVVTLDAPCTLTWRTPRSAP
jgi:hypothetical protein